MSSPANALNISDPGYVIFDGISLFHGRTFQAGAGITLTNASGVSGNTTIALTGGGSAIETINGDTGFISGNVVTIFANNSGNNAGASVSFVNSGTTSTLNLTDSLNNTILGKSAGNLTLTAQQCVIIGVSAGNSLTTGGGGGSVLIGYQAGKSSTTSLNICIGINAGQNITTGTANTIIGPNALGGVGARTGNQNIIIGSSAASGFSSTEASNIIIGSPAVVGDQNTVRIGDQGSAGGQQNKCFIAGIEGTAISGGVPVVVNSSGQLGVSTNPLILFGVSPYTVLSTDYFVSVNTSGGAVTIKLPNAPATAQEFVIKDSTGNAASNNITVTTVGGVVTIDGATSYVINSNYGSISVFFNGSSYEVF